MSKGAGIVIFKFCQKYFGWEVNDFFDLFVALLIFLFKGIIIILPIGLAIYVIMRPNSQSKLQEAHEQSKNNKGNISNNKQIQNNASSEKRQSSDAKDIQKTHTEAKVNIKKDVVNATREVMNARNFCSNCGAKIKQNDKFCRSCGVKLDAIK
ncbi:MAG: zinc ribbon domain-containing protein [Selenomonadaceae bacterium]|nr:zinc ribbon domain-containing protein [Selenomonadaceae bacterium]